MAAISNWLEAARSRSERVGECPSAPSAASGPVARAASAGRRSAPGRRGTETDDGSRPTRGSSCCEGYWPGSPPHPVRSPGLRGESRPLRIPAGKHPYGRELSNLIGELSTRSAVFRVLWRSHDVHVFREWTKRFRYSLVGDLERDGPSVLALQRDLEFRGRGRPETAGQLVHHDRRETGPGIGTGRGHHDVKRTVANTAATTGSSGVSNRENTAPVPPPLRRPGRTTALIWDNGSGHRSRRAIDFADRAPHG
ncbi:hypothetical protein AB0I22_14855 [Streptomyces sp. NPDC050610]|uniref:MmyB family transcriptional regulator n=1 Tax=Streptomyces sp. NPDC050610 TaxID=3157097 RepID=UPI0034193C0D